MQCDKVKDILITDYLDNELEPGSKQKIDEHLSQCRDCSAFKEDLVNITVKPFRGAEMAIPSEFIWRRISNVLVGKQLDGDSLNIANLLSFLRPRWVNVSVISLMLTLTLLIGNYFAQGIWSSTLQKHDQAVIEVSDNLELGVFNDTPGEQAQNATNILE